MSFTVYALFDEREPDAIRYVGFSFDPEKRFYAHIGEAQRSHAKSYRLNWIRKVMAEGSLVHWKALQTFDTAEEAALAEIASIKWHLANGHRLTNGTIGGEGANGFGGSLNPDARARTNASHRTPEYKAKRSVQSSDYWADEENREKQRVAMQAWHTVEDVMVKNARINKIRVAVTGRKYSEESRAKMRAAKLGKPQMPRTEEWKAKISAAQKGKKRRPWTSEERVKIMAARQRSKTGV